MKNLRLVMKTVTNAVAAKFPNHSEAVGFGVLLDRVPYIAEMCAWMNLSNTTV